VQIPQIVELISRSSVRLVGAISDNRFSTDRAWYLFIKRESWLLLRLAVRLFFKLRFKKGG